MLVQWDFYKVINKTSIAFLSSKLCQYVIAIIILNFYHVFRFEVIKMYVVKKLFWYIVTVYVCHKQ